MKRMAQERLRKQQEGQQAEQSKEPQLVIPQLAKLDNKAYKPGKLTYTLHFDKCSHMAELFSVITLYTKLTS